MALTSGPSPPCAALVRPDAPAAEPAVENFSVNLETQRVVVNTTLPQETVFQTLTKTGKATVLVSETK